MARGRGTGEGAAWQQQQRRLGPPLPASPVMSCDTCPVIAGRVQTVPDEMIVFDTFQSFCQLAPCPRVSRPWRLARSPQPPNYPPQKNKSPPLDWDSTP
ncbi:hypothetical protein Pcinc_004858 [Petrolisthes cinctipes]|uniref:Uncharacterized protein n=1 Tax=Petrolisthes cinctipes TaxID=88211 RepID=A0AAE1GGE2_PETCI|nr:hypothetical protein Pcinc_004858 [Petrolisthes cinctipes]